MRRIVFCRENAQLGNRLIVYAHLLAAARERGWDLVNPTFEPYADLFVGTRSRPHGRAMLPVRLAWQAGKILAPLSGGILARARARGAVEVDLESSVPAAESRGARWLLIQGYRIRCPSWVAKQAAALRTFFTPIDAHRIPAEARVAELRARGDVVVGVHVRHGDYAEHLGGRYFYPIAEYAGFMRRVRDLLAPRNVAFLVCSQAAQPPEALHDLTWTPGPGAAAADLHALSCCDLILGPPSSFSAWAAFFGGKPLLRIEHRTQEFTLADFLPQPHPENLD